MTTDELISKIKKNINSGNRGNCDYFIVDEIENLIDEYEKSGSCEKCNGHSDPKRKTGRWASSEEYVKHVEEITGHEQHITYHDDSVYCSQCWLRRNGNWDYCPYCGSYNGGEK